jgi:hypothetical protein
LVASRNGNRHSNDVKPDRNDDGGKGGGWRTPVAGQMAGEADADEANGMRYLKVPVKLAS